MVSSVLYLPAITVIALFPDQCNSSAENLTEINYKVELDIVEERTTIIDEILTPTFIALAASVAAATVIVILLIALICHRFYDDHDDDGDDDDNDDDDDHHRRDPHPHLHRFGC